MKPAMDVLIRQPRGAILCIDRKQDYIGLAEVDVNTRRWIVPLGWFVIRVVGHNKFVGSERRRRVGRASPRASLTSIVLARGHTSKKREELVKKARGDARPTSRSRCAASLQSSANKYSRSVADKLRAKPSSPSTSAIVLALLCCSSQIFSSTVPGAMRR